MGGNALKASHDFETRRVPAAEYHQEIVPALQASLSRLFPRTRVACIPSYGDKPDFGDVDFLIETDYLGSNWVNEVLSEFAPRAWVKNGNVLSFEFRGFQVDLIATKGEEFSWTLAYFAFNDLGNLIGRVAHKMGFKFGHDGLWYVLRDGEHSTHVVEEIRLTMSEWDRALAFLGFDPARYRRGFQTLEEIFNFVTESSCFDRDIFLLENRNHASRIRDRKRKTYTAFLEWVEARPELKQHQWPAEKSAHLARADEAFPGFRARREAAFEKMARNRAIRARFNGDLVRQLTGLQGADLGDRMRDLKALFPNPMALETFVLAATDAQIEQFIKTGEVAPC